MAFLFFVFFGNDGLPCYPSKILYFLDALFPVQYYLSCKTDNDGGVAACVDVKYIYNLIN